MLGRGGTNGNIITNRLDDLTEGHVQCWDLLSEVSENKSWVKSNFAVLDKMKGLDAAKRSKMKELYSNITMPPAEDMPRQFPSYYTREGVIFRYNKYGFPEYRYLMTATEINGTSVVCRKPWKATRAQDLEQATTWAVGRPDLDPPVPPESGFSPNKVRRKSATKIEILKDGGDPEIDDDWIEQTWHHHENGIDLIPVPTLVHAGPLSVHTGGEKIAKTNGNNYGLLNVFSYTEFPNLLPELPTLYQ